MKEILVLLLAAALPFGPLCRGVSHKTFVDGAKAIRNTINLFSQKTQQRALRGHRPPASALYSRPQPAGGFHVDKEARANREVALDQLSKSLQGDLTLINYERLKTQMVSMEKNLRACFDNEFAKDLEEVNSFSEILDFCTGVSTIE